MRTSRARWSTCFGACEIAEAHANLAQRGERDGERRQRSEVLLQRDGALGERLRLLVAMPDQRDVRLVDADDRERVVRCQRRGLTLGQPQRRRRFVVAAALRVHDARQRLHERQVSPVAGGVKRRGRLADVLADDRGVADLDVAERQLVVGEAHRPRVVRRLRVLEGAAVERDRTRLFRPGVGDATVQAPQRREHDVRHDVAERIGRTPQNGAGA